VRNGFMSCSVTAATMAETKDCHMVLSGK
jgi:hypothetical protein